MNLILIDALIGNEYTFCLAKALHDEGLVLTLITPSNREFKTKSDFDINKWMPSKDKRVGFFYKLISYPIYFTKTTKLILSKKKPVVHFQFFRFKTDIFYVVFLRLIGIKTVYTAHNIFPHDRKRLDYFLNFLLYTSVNEIIIHSKTIKDKLLSNFPISEKKTHIIAHGNFDVYVPGKMLSQVEARKFLALHSNDKVLLFFGYIKEYKGLDLLLKAFRIVLEKRQDISLVIAGFPATQKLLVEYLSIIDSIAHKEKILFKPDFIPSEEVAYYFTSADFVVLPYKKIDHSGIVHLAYSFNKPVIATNVGDFEESIEEGKTGYLVNSFSEESFALKIIDAFDSTDKISDMNRYISKLNESKYSWNEVAKETIRVYEGN